MAKDIEKQQVETALGIKNKAGYFYAILASAFFALISILGKVVIKTGMGPVQLMVWQYIFTIVTLLIILLPTKRSKLKLTKKQILRIMLQGIIGSAGTNFFFYAALQYLNAGIVSLLLFTNPIFVVLFFVLTGIKHIRPANWIALGMAFLGSLMVLNVFEAAKGGLPLIGIVLGLMSGICYAFYNVFADLKLQGIEANIINLYSSIFGLITALLVGTFMGIGDYSLPVELIGVIFSLSVLSGILPIIFIYKALSLIGSEKVTVIATIELPITLFLAFLVLGEKMSIIQIFGVVCVIGATFILQQGERESL